MFYQNRLRRLHELPFRWLHFRALEVHTSHSLILSSHLSSKIHRKLLIFVSAQTVRMYLIDDVLVSEELFSEQFTCNLDACKGACCWEGDWGAPLEDAELGILEEIRETLRPYLTRAGNEVIDEVGSHSYFEEPDLHGTPLIEGAACAYLTFDEKGVGQCGIEKAHKDGAVSFQKPVSCHLYPVRHSVEKHLSFQALNFEEWGICSAACTLGQTLKMPAYKFVKEALVRKFGSEFYQSLEQIEQDQILQ